ncbi:MAG TPA: cell wall hydrolase, partial [Lachnospiraceae bacterium]|nr:cell wall hydrolase [Lachnospiraceae bacterium]
AEKNTEKAEESARKAKKSTEKKSSDKKKTKKATYTKADLRLMASIINCEAGAEGYQGKLAVG